MNNLPIMPIRVQYADETTSGKNIDAKFGEVDTALSEKQDTINDQTDIVANNITAQGTLEGGYIKEIPGTPYGALVQNPTWGSATKVYCGAVKTSDKLTLVFCCTVTPSVNNQGFRGVGYIDIPKDVGDKIIPFKLGSLNVVAYQPLSMVNTASEESAIIDSRVRVSKGSTTDRCRLNFAVPATGLTVGATYYFRAELTFLLSNTL